MINSSWRFVCGLRENYLGDETWTPVYTLTNEAAAKQVLGWILDKMPEDLVEDFDDFKVMSQEEVDEHLDSVDRGPQPICTAKNKQGKHCIRGKNHKEKHMTWGSRHKISKGIRVSEQ